MVISAFSGSGAEMRGLSAIDIALWDIFGQATNQPIHQLLGGLSRDKIRTYNTCAGYRYVRTSVGQLTDNWGLDGVEGPYEDLDAFLNRADELAESLLEQGITGMKIWPFDYAAEASERALHFSCRSEKSHRALRKGPKGGRRPDGHHGRAPQSLDPSTGQSKYFRALEPLDPFWFEDPIKMNNFDALGELAASTHVPICASETVATRPVFREMMAKHATGIVMLDLSWVGGISEAKKIATMAEAHHLPVAPHDCTGPVVFAASCHVSLNATNALIQESVRAFYTGWYKELVTEIPEIKDGYIYPLTGPGLGTRLLPDILKRKDATIRRSNAT